MSDKDNQNDNDNQDDNDNKDTVVSIMKDARFCMITTRSGEDLKSRPMTPQEVTDDADVWFFISDLAEQANEIRTTPRINLAFSESSSWVSVSGTGEIVKDRAKIDELWDAAVSAWFLDGKDSAEVALLKVSAESAEYWDSPGGAVASLVSFVKAKATGTRMEGDNETVDLA